jgi:hypothetical protein
MESHTVITLSLCKSSGTISPNCKLFVFGKIGCTFPAFSNSSARNTIHVDDLVSGILSLREDTNLVGPFRVVILPSTPNRD